MKCGRALTADEIELLEGEGVSFDGLDVSKVRIINGKYIPFQNRPMAPDGYIYWPGECGNLASCGGVGTARTFIHEMTHVWQHQQGVNVLGRGFLLHAARVLSRDLFDPYSLKHYDPNGPNLPFNIEQEAQVKVLEYIRWKESQ